LKILYIIDHLRPDGTQRALLLLAEGLAARGHEQAVLSLNESHDPKLAARLRKMGVPVHLIGKRALLLLYGLAAAWRFMLRGRFDLAVTFLFVSDVLGPLLARTAGVPRLVSSQRSRNSDYGFWRRGLVRITLRQTDALVFNSRRVYEYFLERNSWAEGRCSIIQNGVRPSPTPRDEERARTRAALGIRPDQPLIGSVGRLTQAKGQDVLLQALTLMPDRDAALLLIGPGEEECRLRAQAATLGLTDRVLFTGHRRDVPGLLAALDVYVQPSRFEGMPNALLEAMAVGCPIVASAVDGIEELISDGLHGWLVPAEDAGMLALAVQAALENPAEARRRGDAARRRADDEFSVETMVNRWERVLLEYRRNDRTQG
jgi:glycosyltransferase involved in cell wall biosynthesis